MFKILGLVVGLYTLYAIFKGEIYAKSGMAGRTVSRSDSPEYFWMVVTIYALLSIALVTVF